MSERVCGYCGSSLKLLRAGAKYCSTTHRVYASRLLARGAAAGAEGDPGSTLDAMGGRVKLDPSTGGVPSRLTSTPRWVRYNRNKVPLTMNERPASSTDPGTWGTHKDAMKSRVGIGPGFVLNGDGIACLDLDHCLVDGVPSALAARVLALNPHAYVEVSPSGDGLHVWGLAPAQRGWRRTVDGAALEFYTQGRYITVTGQVFRPGDIVDLVMP
jgi:hypothetical protein